MSPAFPTAPPVAIIGGGPAGLMAAEVLSHGGVAVDLYDAMPSVGRKFLLAGKGGLNLTHAEPMGAFLSRYGARRPWIAPLLESFGPDQLRLWAESLGVNTFVGSSGRVFPDGMKAAPLLRAWLRRLRQAGVRFHPRHRWQGWFADGALNLAGPAGEISARPRAVVLALGGGSWARLGSDGAWVPLLENAGVPVAPMKPANCGFNVNWSAHFRTKFAGQPVKPVTARLVPERAEDAGRQGEFVVTGHGVEGSLIYALSASLRNEIEAKGEALLYLDLAPGWSQERLEKELSRPRGARSLSSHLQSRVGLRGVKTGLLRECLPQEAMADPARLARGIKSLPLRLASPRPLDEAISTAGGVPFEALDHGLMLKNLPGVFCAGEMLDWEAPTGGYLLTACFSSGHAAGCGVLAWLAGQG